MSLTAEQADRAVEALLAKADKAIEEGESGTWRRRRDRVKAYTTWRSAPSDIRVDLGSGPLVEGLTLPKDRADAAMEALVARARRVAERGTRLDRPRLSDELDDAEGWWW
ncbi:hypothetical protein [Sinomonas sp. G460-2]|uniref:hypothetical protein n=1 Tax=Sinomonas sp. G460-2 TaxID=3393464 RepID=UPI0039EE5DC9